jgi:hypothetical protein
MPKGIKSKRKSRRYRLSFAIGDHVDLAFDPTNQEWTSIENAYGNAIPSDVRDTINHYVMRYFRLAPAESTAPFIDDAIKYLVRLEKAADRFWKLLHDSEEGAQTDVAGYVRSQMDVHLRRCNYPTTFDLVGIMGVTTVALEEARRDIKNQEGQGFAEGSSWSNLVYELDLLFTENNLTQKIAKFDDPTQASPFVQFFRQLQLLFPTEFRRHDTTFASLTEAMTVARREIRRFVKAREGKIKPGSIQS